MYREVPPLLSKEQITRYQQIAARVDLAPGPGGSRFANFDQARAAFDHELGMLFQRPLAQITVVALYPSAQIVGHTDHPDNVHGLRLHMPLQLNPGCWVFHDGTWQQLELGRSYAMDPTKEHGAVNWGATVRLHLVVDIA